MCNMEQTEATMNWQLPPLYQAIYEALIEQLHVFFSTHLQNYVSLSPIIYSFIDWNVLLRLISLQS